ncbi:MAG: hypothetical protein PVG92_03575, partial [Holophagae bacterium]
MSRNLVVSIALVAVLTVATAAVAGDRALTYEDLMKFSQIEDAVISDDGDWIAYAVVPDRGDSEVVVRSTATDTEYRIERGARPVISSDGLWVAAEITPTLEEREQAKDAKKDDAPKKGLSVVNLRTGNEERLDEVESFAFSEGGRWLVFKRYEVDTTEDEELDEPAEQPEGEEQKEKDKPKLGTALEVRRLGGGGTVIDNVVSYALAEHGEHLAYAVSAPGGDGNGVLVVDLEGEEAATSTLHGQSMGSYTHLAWARDADHLAFAASVFVDEGEAGDAEIWVWTGGDARAAVTAGDAPEGFSLPAANELEWSRDGARLFFGFRYGGEAEDVPSDADAEEQAFDPYDFDAILEGRGVDVWHWNDPRIIPNQKERWEEHEKNRVYRAVVHLDDLSVVPLATRDLPEVFPTDNPSFALAGSDLPYLREITWDGTYGDVAVVDLETGESHPVVKRLAVGWGRSNASLSPDGRFVLYYQSGDWHLWSAETRKAVNLTVGLDVPFANEDHDYPMDPPGYGHSEWMADSGSVLIYDKYDIWQVFTDDRQPRLLTGGEGRKTKTVYRVVDLGPEEDTIPMDANLVLSAYHDTEKHDAFVAIEAESGEMRALYATG